MTVPLTPMSPPETPVSPSSPRQVEVWDKLVRVFHWTLVAAVSVAAVTGFLLDAPFITWHIGAGVVIAVLLVTRLVWAFVGTRYARFSSFEVSPGAMLAHVNEIRTGHVRRHLGHNPAGGVMVLALVLVLTAIVLTGVVVLGGVLKAGPLGFAVTYATGSGAREIHELLSIGLLALVALHIAGATFESLRTRENLARAMVTGLKRDDPGESAARPVIARPGLATVVAGTLILATAAATLSLNARPTPGLPQPMPATVKTECGACHFAYPASLLPRASWTALMAGLSDHFGENASLDTAKAGEIAAYLDANAAEAGDTKAANRLRSVNADKPFQITATRFWTRVHADLPDSLFAQKSIGSRGNCAACHTDAAEGRFYPGSIRIP